MVRKRTRFWGYVMAQWLLNAAFFLSFLSSSESTQQPQLFQCYHTELAIPVREASATIVAYPEFCRGTGVNENYKPFSADLFDSFKHIQLHHSSATWVKLKNVRLRVSPVFNAVRYVQDQSCVSTFDEDHFISLKG